MHYKLQKSLYLAQLKVHSKHLAWRNKANKPNFTFTPLRLETKDPGYPNRYLEYLDLLTPEYLKRVPEYPGKWPDCPNPDRSDRYLRPVRPVLPVLATLPVRPVLPN